MRRLVISAQRLGGLLLLLAVALGPSLTVLPPGLFGEPDFCKMSCSLKDGPCCCKTSEWPAWARKHLGPTVETARWITSGPGCPEACSAAGGAAQTSLSRAGAVHDPASGAGGRAAVHEDPWRALSAKRHPATLPRPPPHLLTVS